MIFPPMASGLVGLHRANFVFGRLLHDSAVPVGTGDVAIAVVSQPVQDGFAFVVDRFHFHLVELSFVLSIPLELLLLVTVVLGLGFPLELIVCLVSLSGSSLVRPETAVPGLDLRWGQLCRRVSHMV